MSAPPLLAGEVHGVRAWRVRRDGDGWTLWALFGDCAWPAGAPLRASCGMADDHVAPDSDCGCGVYAWHPSSRCCRDVMGEMDDQTVAGVVALWGAVEVHEDGVRAEWAAIRALVLPRAAGGSRAAMIRELAGRYGAEVISVSDGDELAAHCASHRRGLDPSVRSRLLAPAVRARRRRRLMAQAGRALGAAAILAGLALGGPPVLGALGEWLSEPAGGHSGRQGAAPRLRIVEQRLLPLGDGTLHVALVRNEDHQRRAVAVHTSGAFRDARGDVVAVPSRPRDVVVSPAIAPGQVGVVADVLDERGLERRVRRLDVRARARASHLGPPQPPVVVGRVSLDRANCLVAARVRSSRPRLQAEVAIVLRDRRGRLSGIAFGWAGPLRAAAIEQVVARLAPRACRRPRSASAFPALTRAELAADARWQRARDLRSRPPARVCAPGRSPCDPRRSARP